MAGAEGIKGIMRTPSFLGTDLFAEWRQRAERARAAQLEDPSATFNAKIWQDFKNQFLTEEFGRCAYCEGRYVAGEFGAAEHYRPKSEVTEDHHKIAHPGYYWLAYEWYNLLLACSKCNSAHPDIDRGPGITHKGKRCEFPVVAARVNSPGPDPATWHSEMDAEEPLLLNPYLDDPRDHFIALQEGWIWYKTEKGRVTINVCHLNRFELRRERKRMRESVLARAHSYWHAYPQAFPPPIENYYFKDTDEFSTYLNCRVLYEVNKLLCGCQCAVGVSGVSEVDRIKNKVAAVEVQLRTLGVSHVAIVQFVPPGRPATEMEHCLLVHLDSQVPMSPDNHAQLTATVHEMISRTVHIVFGVDSVAYLEIVTRDKVSEPRIVNVF